MNNYSGWYVILSQIRTSNQKAYFIFIFACVPNLMSQIPSVLISFGASTKVTLLPVGSRGIQLGPSKRLRLLQCKTEGQIELCTKVCTITTELYQISTNFTQVHPGEQLIERFSHWTLITYISNYINMRQYPFTWKIRMICEQYLTVSCIVLQLGVPPSAKTTSPHLLRCRQYWSLDNLLDSQ